MFHNIFKKTKNKKEEEKPIIIIDIHEKDSLILAELKNSREVEVQLRSLQIADYLVGDTAIERKTIPDLISSMMQKRLYQQLEQLRKYEKIMLILEGDIHAFYIAKTPITHAVRGLIISLLHQQIPIVFSHNYQETAQYLITLAKQQIKNKNPLSLHARIPKTVPEQKKYILEAFPNIGPKKAEKLLEKFQTLCKIFNAEEKELADILKNQAKEFKRLLQA
ncbi:MAG: ERCC4 domain-containing protein [Nanoarchaeota archaeon]